jgi:peptidyl-prolyl cis-trans isomerase SurA
MKSIALLLLAVPLAAQQPHRAPAAPADTTSITIDRVVAIVGDRPILLSEVREMLQQQRAQGLQLPTDTAGQNALARQIIDQIVDEEVLVQKAELEKVEVGDADLLNPVDQRYRELRRQFKSDAEFQQVLRSGGFGNTEEYRRWLMDQARRNEMVKKLIAKLRESGKLVQVSIGDEEVNEAFEKNRGQLPKRPPTVTFRQIIVTPQASAAAKAAAKAKAESLLVDLKKGGDFELLAKRESMDSVSRVNGGDLGWNRRSEMVPAFEYWMFRLAPGQLSPVVETQFGFHIIRVDRARPGEVKARHILIKPTIDSTDVAAAKIRADSVLTKWKGGTPFDTLATQYHDFDEEKGSLQPFERDKLPDSYRTAFEGKKSLDFVDPFPISDPARGSVKYVVSQIVEANEGGDYTLSDFRAQIRDRLAEEASMRRLIDQLRRTTYVAVRY